MLPAGRVNPDNGYVRLCRERALAQAGDAWGNDDGFSNVAMPFSMQRAFWRGAAGRGDRENRIDPVSTNSVITADSFENRLIDVFSKGDKLGIFKGEVLVNGHSYRYTLMSAFTIYARHSFSG